MTKYVLTADNLSMVAGLIRRFFKSCRDKDQYMEDWSHYGTLKGANKTKWKGKYTSMPDPKNVTYVESCNGQSAHIHVELPVTTDIIIGETIYFVGGNRIIRKRGYGNPDCWDFYDRVTRREYDVLHG